MLPSTEDSHSGGSPSESLHTTLGSKQTSPPHSPLMDINGEDFHDEAELAESARLLARIDVLLSGSKSARAPRAQNTVFDRLYSSAMLRGQTERHPVDSASKASSAQLGRKAGNKASQAQQERKQRSARVHTKDTQNVTPFSSRRRRARSASPAPRKPCPPTEKAAMLDTARELFPLPCERNAKESVGQRQNPTKSTRPAAAERDRASAECLIAGMRERSLDGDSPTLRASPLGSRNAVREKLRQNIDIVELDQEDTAAEERPSRSRSRDRSHPGRRTRSCDAAVQGRKGRRLIYQAFGPPIEAPPVRTYFGTTSSRFQKIETGAQDLGPGQYAQSLASPSSGRKAKSWLSKAPRFRESKEERERAELPGPGMYTPALNKDGNSPVSSDVREGPALSAVFRSHQPRFPKSNGDTPAPGTYNVDSYSLSPSRGTYGADHGQSMRPSSSFLGTKERIPYDRIQSDDCPPPGLYNVSSSFSVPSGSQQSPARRPAEGKPLDRHSYIPKSDTPAVGTYKADLVTSESRAVSSPFRSRVRKGLEAQPNDVPGPGSYYRSYVPPLSGYADDE